MKKFMSKLTEKYIKLESSGKTGLRYKLYGLILKHYKKHENKTISRKWFWFWGRFHLPPYWWRTRTFKVITSCMVFISLVVVLGYFLINRGAEDIVNEIDLPVIESSQESKNESSDDFSAPRMVEGSLDNFSNEKSYDFLRYDLSDACKKNGDTVGWVTVDYCGINYPVVQAVDNDYYLHHDFYKSYNFHGWIFRDCRYIEDSPHYNTVIYGHNLMVGGMFSNLSAVLDSKEPVYVKYQTTFNTYIYEVISAYPTPPVLSYIQMDFKSIDEVRKFHKSILKNNQWKSAPKVELTDEDKILTLSTCHGNNRLAVHCRLIASEVL